MAPSAIMTPIKLKGRLPAGAIMTLSTGARTSARVTPRTSARTCTLFRAACHRTASAPSTFHRAAHRHTASVLITTLRITSLIDRPPRSSLIAMSRPGTCLIANGKRAGNVHGRPGWSHHGRLSGLQPSSPVAPGRFGGLQGRWNRLCSMGQSTGCPEGTPRPQGWVGFRRPWKPQRALVLVSSHAEEGSSSEVRGQLESGAAEAGAGAEPGSGTAGQDGGKAKPGLGAPPPDQALIEKESPDRGGSWLLLFSALFLVGTVVGPLLDGIASAVGLRVYDEGALQLGPLNTDVWMFPLCGLFFALVGGVQPFLDEILVPPTDEADRWREMKPPLLVVNLLFVPAVIGQAIAFYRSEAPIPVCHLGLAGYAMLSWALFDMTAWGAALGLGAGATAMALELALMKWLGWWHYPRPDLVFGDTAIVSWVIWVYFLYTPALGNMARFLKARLDGEPWPLNN